ncbi:hypothetical protein DSLPV1_180 [Dishui lake phycodnavirus 1]|uniref:hypothetical protein n=1 Tax=Dishui lake phycodnavirus 1 TaxID=2079134 RepID=UPI000CD69C42|nr:hypothetical protein C5Y57_gp218 [Dishui lake phycodnavirus 1]AUT19151.1 hypothetical protein DSLPV1_180 [Dishui lake phycodnavirus 1]
MTDLVKKFDCKNKEHVEWLKRFTSDMAMATSGGRADADIVKTMNENPLGVSVEIPSIAYIHFQLAMKYTTAVLNRDAWIPE